MVGYLLPLLYRFKSEVILIQIKDRWEHDIKVFLNDNSFTFRFAYISGNKISEIYVIKNLKLIRIHKSPIIIIHVSNNNVWFNYNNKTYKTALENFMFMLLHIYCFKTNMLLDASFVLSGEIILLVFDNDCIHMVHHEPSTLIIHTEKGVETNDCFPNQTKCPLFSKYKK